MLGAYTTLSRPHRSLKDSQRFHLSATTRFSRPFSSLFSALPTPHSATFSVSRTRHTHRTRRPRVTTPTSTGNGSCSGACISIKQPHHTRVRVSLPWRTGTPRRSYLVAVRSSPAHGRNTECSPSRPAPSFSFPRTQSALPPVHYVARTSPPPPLTVAVPLSSLLPSLRTVLGSVSLSHTRHTNTLTHAHAHAHTRTHPEGSLWCTRPPGVCRACVRTAAAGGPVRRSPPPHTHPRQGTL